MLLCGRKQHLRWRQAPGVCVYVCVCLELQNVNPKIKVNFLSACCASCTHTQTHADSATSTAASQLLPPFLKRPHTHTLTCVCLSVCGCVWVWVCVCVGVCVCVLYVWFGVCVCVCATQTTANNERSADAEMFEQVCLPHAICFSYIALVL